LLSLRPESKAARDQSSLLGGRTSTLLGGKTRSLMPGRKSTKPDEAAAPKGALGLPLTPRAGGLTPRRAASASKLSATSVEGGASDQSGRAVEETLVEETEAVEIHAGFMTKKGEGLVAKWQERWFVLYADGSLTYAEREGCGPKGIIELASLKRGDLQRAKLRSASDYSFSIKTPGRKWQLNPGTEKSFDVWEEKIIGVMKD